MKNEASLLNRVEEIVLTNAQMGVALNTCGCCGDIEFTYEGQNATMTIQSNLVHATNTVRYSGVARLENEHTSFEGVLSY